MSRIYDNIRYACMISGVTMKEIEAPKSAGYISRYEKQNRIEEIPIRIFKNLSDKCNIPIEDLLNKDLTREAEMHKIQMEITKLQDKLERMRKENHEGA